MNNNNNNLIPVYNKKESLNTYLRKVEAYKRTTIQVKYTEILKFINLWTNRNFIALTEFKNIPESILLKDIEHNNEIIEKYCEIFKTKFEVDFGIKNVENDEENKHIITLLRKMLGLIDYVLYGRGKGSNKLYTIRKKML